MLRINSEVVYIDNVDLSVESNKKPINEISITDLADKSIIQNSSIIIFKRGFDYKVLKSRW